jgi:hypothetical protein
LKSHGPSTSGHNFVCDAEATDTIAIENTDGGAFSGQTQSHSTSNPISSTSDQSDPTFQLPHLYPAFAIFRLRSNVGP